MISLFCEFLDRNLQLGIDLVDDRACAAGALIIHRRNFLVAPRFVIIFEDNDLRVLSTQLDDRIHFGMELFHRQRNRRDLLNELAADLLGNAPSPRTGQEHASVVAANAGVLSQSPLAVAGTDTGTRARFQKCVSLSMRSLTCRMNWAAVPATPWRCGT